MRIVEALRELAQAIPPRGQNVEQREHSRRAHELIGELAAELASANVDAVPLDQAAVDALSQSPPSGEEGGQ